MTKKKGLYIHIPFCVKKCNYCAFLSFSANSELMKAYTKAIVREIELRANNAAAVKTAGDMSNAKHPNDTDRQPSIKNRKPEVDTVYIGGGTPSVIDVSEMRDIMHAIRSNFDIKTDAEITIEANPGTLGREDREILDRLTAYRSMGFNRLSMGVQSMDNERLKFIGRVHTAEDVARDVRIARQAGFDNINLDIIFSLPGERTEDALEDARRIISLGPEHISCYSLQIEEGTPMAEMIDAGKISEVPDEEDRETYHRICDLLKESGYEHYEISNFAKIAESGYGAPGFGSPDKNRSNNRSKHNSLYWDMSDYMACGLGASGFEDNIRYKNEEDIEAYIEAAVSGKVPTTESHENTPFDNISEAVFTALRRREGVSYEEAYRAYSRVRAEEKLADDAAKFADVTLADATKFTDATLDGAAPAYATLAGLTPAEKMFWEVFADARDEANAFTSSGHLIIDEEGLRLTESGIDISNQIMALFV